MVEHPRAIWVGAIVSWLVLILPVVGGENGEQLVAAARDGSRAAISSITSMQCRYERLPWANTTPEQAFKHWGPYNQGRFWRSGDTYRLSKPMGDGSTLNSVVRNFNEGRVLCLKTGGPCPWPLLSIGPVSLVNGVGGDMWQWLLFTHWGQTLVSYYPFHDILARPHVIRTAERLPPPANDIHIELTHENGRLEFWFDPKVNYLIRKSVMVPAVDKPTTLRWENEVVEFAELAPAVFVPLTVEHRCSSNGALQAVLRTRLSEVKVNQPLDKNAFRLPGIAGLECIDLTHEVKFKVDADGNRVGPEIPYKMPRVTGGAVQGGDSPPPVKHSPDIEPSRPPTPLWVWLLSFSVLVLVAAFILADFRRRKRAAQP